DLITRLLTELSYEELVQLDKIVQSERPQLGNLTSALSTSIVQHMVSEAKKAKPELVKLEKVTKLFEEKKLDEAVAVLDTMDSTLSQQISAIRENIAEIYRKKGDTAKAERLLKGSSTATINETPAETVKTQAGLELVHSGMENLRAVLPGARASLPTNDQM